MDNQLRIINTARSEQAINKAAQQGYWPLIKQVIPSPEIRIKYAVLQDSNTGKVQIISDYRLDRPTDKTVKVIDFTYYYPHHFESPFAAYLIPSDIKVGERVCLIDLIEDVVGQRWNQGDTYRLPSCEAIWDGKDLILQVQPILGATFSG